MSGWASGCRSLSERLHVQLGQRVVDGLVEHGAAADLAVDDRGGTLPLRKPGTLICLAIFWYAASRLGLSSSKGTSTVSLARVGLRVSTALFTGFSSSVGGAFGLGLSVDVGATGLEPAISCSQSRRASHYATPRQKAPIECAGGS